MKILKNDPALRGGAIGSAPTHLTAYIINRVVIKEKATIQSGSDFIEIPLEVDDGREVATLQIDGVSYHFERIRKETLLDEYKVDGDPYYVPQADEEGYCYILEPFCE